MKPKEKTMKVLVTLPCSLKAFLDDMKLEGYTASGYVTYLLRQVLQARIDTNWIPGRGWGKASLPKNAAVMDARKRYYERKGLTVAKRSVAC